MNFKKIILGYTKYNYWANEKLSSWLLSLNRELLYKQTTSSFTSIELTVQHMQQAQQFWLGIITKKTLSIPNETDAAVLTFSLLLTGSRLMLETLETYTEKELLEKIKSTDMVQSRYEFILHSINHNTYHRGQIITMGRQLGVVENIPSMDYEAFLWSSH